MTGILSIARRSVWVLPLILGLAWAQWNGYEGLNGADSHDYFRVSRAWAAWLHGGERPPAAEHPAAFPLTGAVLGTLTGDILLALRCIPFVSFLLIGLVMMRLVPRQGLAGPASVAFVLLSIGASPFLLRHALVVMSDVPAAALVFISFGCLVIARERSSAKWFLLAVLAGVLALSFRFAAVPMVGGAVLWLVWEKCVGRSRRIFHMGIVLVVLSVALLFTFRPAWLAGHCVGTPIEHWSGLNLFRTEHHSDDGVLRYRVPNILYVVSIVVHPGFMPIGLLLLPSIRMADFRSHPAQLAMSMVLGYLLFTAGLPFQNDRVMLMVQPFSAFLFAPAFGRAWEWVQGRRVRPWLVVTAIAMGQMGLFARAVHAFMRNARTERELAGTVLAQHATRIYTHGMGPALSNYCPGVEVTELWYGRIDRFEPTALVLVDPKNLEEQWQGLPPWENWRRVQQQGVEQVEERPDGWLFVRVK
jgi:hypothetical protein